MDFKTGFELSNGVRIPCIGFGTWQSRDGEGVAAVKSALEAGYRLIDTAAAYGNELSVGAAIRESCVPRDQIFITSKLRNSAHGYDATMEAFEWSTQKLGTDYLDLYLIHWPNPLQFRPIWKEATRGTWRAFEALYRAGRIRAIGVSNFMPHHIEMLMETASIQPMVNQLKLCPGITQDAAVEYCRARGILVEAYSPFGTGSIFSAPEIREIAARYRKSIGQVCLRWSLQMGYLPLPKSGNPARIRENLDVFDFDLSEEDMAKIASLKGSCGEAPDPDATNF
mgnify:CR=1 FL=1